MKRIWKSVTVVATVFAATSAMAGLAPDLKCQATKNKLVGGYYACRMKAEATAVAKGGGADYTKCSEKFTEKWNKAESDSGDLCPDTVMVTFEADAFVGEQATAAAQLVSGATSTKQCGDNDVNIAGEQCDGTDLGGNTCATFGKYGTIACNTDCELDLDGCSDCPPSMVQYGGSCWTLGTAGGNCDAACSAVGLVYDAATLNVAGSAGTDANCLALLYAFDTPGDVLNNAGGNCPGAPVGCAMIPGAGFRARCGTPATDSTGTFTDAQRVCACH